MNATSIALALSLLVTGASPQRDPQTQLTRKARAAAAPGAPAAPLVVLPACLDRIKDQAGGPCLEASSMPAPGKLFPPPHDGGVGNVASGLTAFVGGGTGNNATFPYAAIAGGQYNAATRDHAAVGGGFLNAATDYCSVVAGGSGNAANGDFSTVGGGISNTVNGTRATISGGANNQASATYSTVGGGRLNVGIAQLATIGGGAQNLVSGSAATIAGGSANSATNTYAAIVGGASNTATGYASTVAGGRQNSAAADFSFAAGRRAKANHQGSFVFADSINADRPSSADNQFNVFASGGTRIFSNALGTTGVSLAAGAGTWSTVSDRAAKENVLPIDAREVLERVAALPIQTWNYISQDDAVRHMGPMAQDFRAAFGLGVSATLIDAVDPDGVALAAIQGLYALSRDQSAELERLRADNEALRVRLERLERATSPR